MQFIYDSCFFYINSNNKSFGIVGLQTNHTHIFVNDIFAAAKEKTPKQAKLLAKHRKKQTLNSSIKFNKCYIKLTDDNSFFFNQKKQCQCLRLIVIKNFMNLMSSCGKIRKAITPEDIYVAQ